MDVRATDVEEREKRKEGGEREAGEGRNEKTGETADDDDGNFRPASMPIPPIAHAAQLTIFYAGSVSVYDSVLPEKAQAIMLIAAATAAAAKAAANNKTTRVPMTTISTLNAAAASPVLAQSLSLPRSCATIAGAGTAARQAISTQPQLLPNPNSSCCKLQAELPISRRHSLQRFLEKRRDRLVSRAPYPSAKITDGMEMTMDAKPQTS